MRTAVWIDHRQARVFHVSADEVGELTVAAPQYVHRSDPKDPKSFFHDVARSLERSQQILVVGPSTAKLELLRYLRTHDHALESRIVGLETVDHPTDGQLAALARSYFKLVRATSDTRRDRVADPR